MPHMRMVRVTDLPATGLSYPIPASGAVFPTDAL
jgi:hypothetical protein